MCAVLGALTGEEAAGGEVLAHGVINLLGLALESSRVPVRTGTTSLPVKCGTIILLVRCGTTAVSLRSGTTAVSVR